MDVAEGTAITREQQQVLEETWIRSRVGRELCWMVFIVIIFVVDLSWRGITTGDMRYTAFMGFATLSHSMRLAIILWERRKSYESYLWWRKCSMYINRFGLLAGRVALARSRGMEDLVTCDLMSKAFMANSLGSMGAAMATPLPMREQLRFQLLCTAMSLTSLLVPGRSFCHLLQTVVANEPSCVLLPFVRRYQQVLEGVAVLVWGGRVVEPPQQFVPYCREALVTLYVSCGLTFPMALAYCQQLAVRRQHLLDRGMAPPTDASSWVGGGRFSFFEIVTGVFLSQAILMQVVGLLLPNYG